MPRPKKLEKTESLAIVENVEIPPESASQNDESSDEDLEVKPTPVREKRKLTEKQLENLNKGRLKAKELADKRKAEKQKEEEEWQRHKQEIAEKKKARQERRRKEQLESEGLTDNESSDEEIIVKKRKPSKKKKKVIYLTDDEEEAEEKPLPMNIIINNTPQNTPLPKPELKRTRAIFC